MKLTRRSILLGFLLAFFSLLVNRNRPLKAQSETDLGEACQLPPLLENNNFDAETVYLYFSKLTNTQVQKPPYNQREKELPPLLYWGLNRSCFQRWEMPSNLSYLKTKPKRSAFQSDRGFTPYPDRGIIPNIDDNGLEFLHPDIKEACLCLGRFSGNRLESKWLGRNALENGEFWSSTKPMALLHLLYASSQKNPQGEVKNYVVEGITGDNKDANLSLDQIASDIVTYENDYLNNQAYSSNSLASMTKRFFTRDELEIWLRSLTGNQELTLWGRYGEKPFVDQPQLIDTASDNVILCPISKLANFCDCNRVCAYDLTRIMSMIGWHYHLDKTRQQIPISDFSLASLVEALRKDPARLTDLAIDALGMNGKLNNVVILSKLGNGATSSRQRTEAVYVAFFQGIDKRTGEQISLTMTLKGGLALDNRSDENGEYNQDILEQERVQLDARMATEVTGIIWRVLNAKI